MQNKYISSTSLINSLDQTTNKWILNNEIQGENDAKENKGEVKPDMVGDVIFICVDWSIIFSKN